MLSECKHIHVNVDDPTVQIMGGLTLPHDTLQEVGGKTTQIFPKLIHINVVTFD